jgi:hypothetical protein
MPAWPTPVYKKRKKTTYHKYKQHKYVLGDRTLMVQGYEPQALDYMLTQGFTAEEIRCEVEGTVPNIWYRYNKRTRLYIPDMFVLRRNLIIEVKSMSTLGLLNNKRRGWSMTCAKALACHKAGYKFALLLMTAKGQRIKLPKNWVRWSKADVKEWVKLHSGLVDEKTLL